MHLSLFLGAFCASLKFTLYLITSKMLAKTVSLLLLYFELTRFVACSPDVAYSQVKCCNSRESNNEVAKYGPTGNRYSTWWNCKVCQDWRQHEPKLRFKYVLGMFKPSTGKGFSYKKCQRLPCLRKHQRTMLPNYFTAYLYYSRTRS